MAAKHRNAATKTMWKRDRGITMERQIERNREREREWRERYEIWQSNSICARQFCVLEVWCDTHVNGMNALSSSNWVLHWDFCCYGNNDVAIEIRWYTFYNLNDSVCATCAQYNSRISLYHFLCVFFVAVCVFCCCAYVRYENKPLYFHLFFFPASFRRRIDTQTSA